MSNIDLEALDEILGDDAEMVNEPVVQTRYRERRDRSSRRSRRRMESATQPTSITQPTTTIGPVDALDDALFGLSISSKKNTTPIPSTISSIPSEDVPIQQEKKEPETNKEPENQLSSPVALIDSPRHSDATPTADEFQEEEEDIVPVVSEVPIVKEPKYVPRNRSRSAIGGRRSMIDTGSSSVKDTYQPITEPVKIDSPSSITTSAYSNNNNFNTIPSTLEEEPTFKKNNQSPLPTSSNDNNNNIEQTVGNTPTRVTTTSTKTVIEPTLSSSSSFSHPHQPTHNAIFSMSPRINHVKLVNNVPTPNKPGYGNMNQQNNHINDGISSRIVSDTELAYLTRRVQIQEETISELTKRKQELTADLHSANMNAAQLVEEARQRHDKQNDEEIKRLNDLYNMKRDEVEKERELHSETKRIYDNRMRMMAMELTSVNNQAVTEAEERARESLEEAYKLQEQTLQQQREHFDREIETMRSIHQRELDALKRQSIDSIFLKNLASKVENSAQSIESLHTRVNTDRSSSERMAMDQLKIREQMLKEKEEKLTKKGEQQNEMLISLNKLSSEHENERIRLKKEHQRLTQLQEESSTQNSILREQLLSERDSAVRERAELKHDKQEWLLEKKRLMSELSAQKEMIQRTRKQIAQEASENKREQADIMATLDVERRELSQLKKHLQVKRTLLEDRIEKLQEQELRFKKNVQYVEKNMHELQIFGSKVKNQSQALAQAWKSAKIEIKQAEEAKKVVEHLQNELKSQQEKMVAQYKMIEKERASLLDSKQLRDQSSSNNNNNIVRTGAYGIGYEEEKRRIERSSQQSISLLEEKQKLSQSLTKIRTSNNNYNDNNIIRQQTPINYYQSSSVDSLSLDEKYARSQISDINVYPTYNGIDYPNNTVDHLALQQQLDAMHEEAEEMKEFLMQEEEHDAMSKVDDNNTLGSLDDESMSKFSAVPSSVMPMSSADSGITNLF